MPLLLIPPLRISVINPKSPSCMVISFTVIGCIFCYRTFAVGIPRQLRKSGGLRKTTIASQWEGQTGRRTSNSLLWGLISTMYGDLISSTITRGQHLITHCATRHSIRGLLGFPVALLYASNMRPPPVPQKSSIALESECNCLLLAAWTSKHKGC